jgi:hypothetical protein
LTTTVLTTKLSQRIFLFEILAQQEFQCRKLCNCM